MTLPLLSTSRAQALLAPNPPAGMYTSKVVGVAPVLNACAISGGEIGIAEAGGFRIVRINLHLAVVAGARIGIDKLVALAASTLGVAVDSTWIPYVVPDHGVVEARVAVVGRGLFHLGAEQLVSLAHEGVIGVRFAAGGVRTGVGNRAFPATVGGSVSVQTPRLGVVVVGDKILQS